MGLFLTLLYQMMLPSQQMRRERIIDKAKHEEEQRHQNRILHLTGIAFRDSQWCVHGLKICPILFKTVPDYTGTKFESLDLRP